MRDMVTPDDEDCPFKFNFDATTFKAGDIVSYRVPEAFDDMPFVGILLEVHEDHVILAHYGEHEKAEFNKMRGTRDDRPEVSKEDALA